jgi:hypothetical protein
MKAIILFSTIILACTAVRAQEPAPRVSEGDRALLFSIDGFGTFGVRGTSAGGIANGVSMNDSSVGFTSAATIYGAGAKYFFAPRIAARLALGFGSSSQSQPGANGSGSSSASFVGIAPAAEFHLVQSGRVSGYLGGFLSFAITSSARGADQERYGSSASSVSIGGLLGVEFFAFDGLSLGAEYQLGARFSSSSSQTRGATSEGPSATDIGIGTLAVSLGVYL